MALGIGGALDVGPEAFLPYCLRAITGSIRAARRAGTYSALHRDQATNEQARADDQHYRERDLRADEPPAQPGRRPA